MSTVTIASLKTLEKIALSLVPKPPGKSKTPAVHPKAEEWKKVAKANFSDGHQKGLAHLASQIFDAPVEQFLPGSVEYKWTKGQAIFYDFETNNGQGVPTRKVIFATRDYKGGNDYARYYSEGEFKERTAYLPGQPEGNARHARFATAEEIKKEILTIRADLKTRSAKTELPW